MSAVCLCPSLDCPYHGENPSQHDTYASECREHVPGTPAHSGGRCPLCDATAPEPPVTADHTPERLGAEAMSIGALREAIINATELDGAFGQNVHESKAVMLRVGDRCYPLAEVSVGFYADTGRFVMFLTADDAALPTHPQERTVTT